MQVNFKLPKYRFRCSHAECGAAELAMRELFILVQCVRKSVVEGLTREDKESYGDVA
jgi:hypothetical protein